MSLAQRIWRVLTIQIYLRPILLFPITVVWSSRYFGWRKAWGFAWLTVKVQPPKKHESSRSDTLATK